MAGVIWGSTPLHAATSYGHFDLVKFLIGQRADLNRADHNGSTPLHMASSKGRLDVVEFLIAHGADLNGDDEDWTPLHATSSNGRLVVGKFPFTKVQNTIGAVDGGVHLSTRHHPMVNSMLYRFLLAL